jgi:hypothetical protein
MKPGALTLWREYKKGGLEKSTPYEISNIKHKRHRYNINKQEDSCDGRMPFLCRQVRAPTKNGRVRSSNQESIQDED